MNTKCNSAFRSIWRRVRKRNRHKNGDSSNVDITYSNDAYVDVTDQGARAQPCEMEDGESVAAQDTGMPNGKHTYVMAPTMGSVRTHDSYNDDEPTASERSTVNRCDQNVKSNELIPSVNKEDVVVCDTNDSSAKTNSDVVIEAGNVMVIDKLIPAEDDNAGSVVEEPLHASPIQAEDDHAGSEVEECIHEIPIPAEDDNVGSGDDKCSSPSTIEVIHSADCKVVVDIVDSDSCPQTESLTKLCRILSTDESTQQDQSVISHVLVKEDIFHHEIIVGINEETKSLPPTVIPQACVEFSHVADSFNELTINVGETIKNVILHDDGWSQGDLNGKHGIFPTSCLEIEVTSETTNEDNSFEEDGENPLVKSDDSSRENDAKPNSTGETGNDAITEDETVNGTITPESNVAVVATQHNTTVVTGELAQGSVVTDDVGTQSCMVTQESDAGAVTEALAEVNSNTTDNDTQTVSIMVSDQGFSKTCTSHALAKALCALFPSDVLHAQNIADCLNQIFKDLEGTCPEEYNGKSIKVVKQNKPGSIVVSVEPCEMQDMNEQSANQYQFVVIYRDGDRYHSIYVKEKKENSFLCINSWGDSRPEVDVLADKVEKVYRIAARWVSDTLLEEPVIKSLSYGDIEKIASKLDQSGYNDWNAFGMKLAEQYGKEISLEKSEIENLHLFYCGGGSPATTFLENVKICYPMYTLSDFRAIAVKFKRMDIYYEMEKWTEETLLIKLTSDRLKSLASLLDKKSMKDWKCFADELEFSYDEIKQMQSVIKTPGEMSPSKELISRIMEKAPNFKLCHLRKVFADITRNDIVEIFNGIIEHHKNEMIK